MNNFIRKLPFNYLHYYLIALVILFLGLENSFLFLFYIPFYFLIKDYKNKHYIVIVVIFFVFYLSLYSAFFKQEPKGNDFIVINKVENETYYTYYVQEKRSKFVFYSNDNYEIGDILSLSYDFIPFEGRRTPNGFNLKRHYLSQRVFYKLKVSESKILGNEFHLNQIRESLKKKLDIYPEEVKRYLKIFIFADDTFTGEYQQSKASLGIIHLFALSGMHVNFLIMVIETFCKKLKINLNKKVMFTFLFFYLWLASFSISLLRAVIMYVVYSLFNNKGMSKLDSLSATFMLIIIINPFYRFKLGFILSFIVTFLLILFPYKKGFSSILINHYKIILITLLIISNINKGLYPVSIITSFLFTLIFPVVILPLIALSFIPFLSLIIEPFLKGLSQLILNLGNDLLIKLPYQNMISVLIYLSLFVFVVYTDSNKIFLKRSFLLVFYVFILYISPAFNINKTIYFLDVGQGDATFIQNTFNKGNVLIDANKGTLEFLNTLGDIEIDYFFITHGDLDHSADAKDIIEEFQVNNIIISPYDDSTIINSLKSYGLKLGRVGDLYEINNLKIEILGPLKKYNSLNDNSLVLKLISDNITYLFAGDAEKEAINDLILFYKKGLKSDVLHVSHHGAINGTTLEFLNYVDPKKAIISVGKNNFYNHPHPNIISKLKSKNINIYLTSKQQTIIKRRYQFSF